MWSEDKLNKKFVVAENFAELVSKGKRICLFPKVSDCFPGRVRDLTLFEALTGGAFDRLNWQHSGEFDQFLKKNAPAFARGDGRFWNWSVHYDLVKIKNRSREGSHKLYRIGVGKIRTFPFLPIPVTTPSLSSENRLSESEESRRHKRKN